MASHQQSDARETITTQDEEGDHSATNDETPPGTASTNPGNVEILKIGDHVCPMEYANNFTPMEFEEVCTRVCTVETGEPMSLLHAVRQFHPFSALCSAKVESRTMWAVHACVPARRVGEDAGADGPLEI